MTTPKTIALVTGATGAPELRACLASANQLESDPRLRVEHWVMIDGDEYTERVHAICEQVPASPELTRRVVTLPKNTGRDGGTYLCHRVIAATSYMVPDTWWMAVLDQDTTLDPSHIRRMADAMDRVPTARWGYTMRMVTDGELTVPDYVESMGLIRLTCLGNDKIPDRLVDTNCYAFRTDLARELAPLWGCTTARNPEDIEADRKVIQTLSRHEPKAWSTRYPTVVYKTGNRDDSVQISFFTEATALPWDPERRDLYIFHFSGQETEVAINPEHPKHLPLAEWCPTMLDGLRDQWNLINGFECLHGLPHDAMCFISMCHPGTLPLEHLRQLKTTTHPDMTRILYTAEGPNARHQAQWTEAFLTQAADIVLTYSRHVLDNPAIKTVACPHNARFLSPETVDEVCRENRGPVTGTVAMVLEPREGTETYTIDAVTYTRLDGLRRQMATGFGPSLTVVGHGWQRVIDAMPEKDRPTLGYDTPRMTDTKTSIETLVDHDFALIVENTDCPGYVSEKIGDALIAGTIPLYDGRSLDWAQDTSDVPRDVEILLQGKNQWWFDIRDAIDPASDQPMGHQLRTWLERQYLTTDAMIHLVKTRIRETRREYLLSRGTQAICDGVEACIRA
jgi:hypothetical protein